MKIALATTTIHIPHALKLMREIGPDVRFFVALDEKSPIEAVDLCNSIGGAVHLHHGSQPWKCSEAIGWQTLARRNIAFLEALKWGADVIYSWDNDNIPIDGAHFYWMSRFRHPVNGIRVTGTDGWFDPGQLLIPPTRHRGFPYDKPVSKTAYPVLSAKVGVAAGLVIGNPDCDAVTRMASRPDIGSVHILGSTGVVVDPYTWTVFNSQNTAVIRDLIPAWFMMPGVGRHDDIYASLIVQRVARERGYHTHFGPPFTYQQRNDHNLVTDLRNEIDGMENVVKIAALLDRIELDGESVIGDTQFIYGTLYRNGLIPGKAHVAAVAWLEDCRSVL
jgi:hypothetical protein